MGYDYNKQAKDFLESTGTMCVKRFSKLDYYFSSDKDKRNIWNITISNKYHTYTFQYGDSIHNTNDAGNYSVKQTANKYIDWVYKKLLTFAERQKGKYRGRDSIIKVFNNGGYGSAHNVKSFEEIINVHIIPNPPSDYDILTCFNVMYEDNFTDRCRSYGYDDDSISAKNIYEKCIDQDRSIRMMFDRKEIEQLMEIQ